MPIVRYSRYGLARRRLLAVVAALMTATTFVVVPGAAAPAHGQVPDTPVPGSCGADILFVLDTSGSMVSAGLNAVERAVETFTAELGKAPSDGGAPDSRIAAVHFSNGAATGIGSYLDVVTDRAAIDAYVSPGGAYRSHGHDWTNWQAAFEQANGLPTPDYVFFLTDGQPTRTNSTPAGSGNHDYDTNAAAAVPAATALRNAVPGDTTVVGIGVGSDFTTGQAENIARLQSVVDTVTTSTFADLADALAVQINIMCSPTITVTKTATPDALVEPGGDFDFSVRVTNTSSSGADVRLTTLTDQVDGEDPVDITSIAGAACASDASGARFDPSTDWLGAGASMTCTWTTTLVGPPGTSESDTVTATAVDPAGRTAGPVRASETISVSDDPSVLSIDKSASPGTLGEPGGDVEYTVVVTNDSAVDSITLSTLVDDRFGDVTATCSPSVAGVVLAPDGTHTCTFSETIQIDGGGTHVNVIEVIGTDDDGITRTATDDATVTVTDDLPSISLVKTASETSVVEPGENVTFTIRVTNDSGVDSVTIDSLTDSEFADAATICSPSFVGATLTPGESAACSFTELITSPHTNTATVTATGDDGDDLRADDTATIEFEDTGASIAVTKVAHGRDVNIRAPGEKVTFDVTVSNTSQVDSVTITSLTDQVGSDPAFPITEVTGPVLDTDCSVPQVITAGDDYSCSFTIFVGGSEGDQVTDEVTASGTSEDDEAVMADDTETIFFDNAWRIVFHKRVCDSYGEIRSNEYGDQLRESILPLGPTIDDEGMPVDEAWEDANHDCTPVEGWPFTVGFGVLSPGEGPYGGLADSLSHVSPPDGTVVTDADGRAVLELTDDQLLDLIIGQGDLWIMEGRYEGSDLTFPNENMGFGTLRCGTDAKHGDNVEFVRASDFANRASTATCFAYNVLEDPDLDIDKNAVTIEGEAYEPGDVAEVGQVIDYSITVANSGNVPLTGVTVHDADLDGPVACTWPGTPGALGVGDTVTCSGSRTVTLDDGEAGTFLNVATADANEIDEPVSDDAEVPTVIPDAPALEVTKDVDLDVVDVAGTVEYTITVSNVGTLTLTDLTLEDVLSYDGTSERITACESPDATTLEPGRSTTAECQVDLDVLVHGVDVLNTVTATATASNGEDVSDQDSAATRIVPPPTDGSLAIDKLAGPFGSEAGDNAFVDLYTRAPGDEAVTWQITITNQTDHRLSNVAFTDPATPACEAAFGDAVSSDEDGPHLAPGEVLVITCDDTLGTGIAKENVASVGATDPWDRSVPVVEDEARTQSVAASATIGDTVWSDDNRNGVQDQGEKGIAGATVRLRLPDGTTIDASTNSEGRYLFSALAAGTYEAELILGSIPEPDEGSLQSTTPRSFTVTLSDGQAFLDADFGVAATLPNTGISSDRIAVIGLVLLLLGTLAVIAARIGVADDEA